MLLTDRLLDALHIVRAVRRIDLSACMEPIHYNPEGDTMNDCAMTDPTCQQRIAAHLKSREEDTAALLEQAGSDDGKTAEEAQEALYEFPLDVSTYTTLRVDLSTGGPADYLTCIIEASKYGHERTSPVRYHFADWFDHADMALDEDSPLVQWVDSIVDVWQS